jgi:hypothetical protein
MSYPSTEFTNENGGSIRAHVVTEDTAGPVNTVDGTRDATPGQVLIETNQPGVYHLQGSEALDGWNKAEEESDADVPNAQAESDADNESADDAENEDTAEEWDPGAHSATEVRARILSLRQNGNTQAADRLVEQEQSGRNRYSAIPR